MTTITCSGNVEAVLAKLLEAGANAEIDGGNLIVNTRLGRELINDGELVTIEETPGGKVAIVESSRHNNPDANPGGVPA